MVRCTWFVTLLLIACMPSAYAHSEYNARYVVENGTDRGQCDSPLRPCKTIAYAASRTVKGEKIFVAGGNYPILSTQELFYLTSGTIQVFGGYNRFEHFQKQSPAENPTRLIGVPSAYRKQLEKRGFQIIADGKSVSRRKTEELNAFVAQHKRLQSSKRQAPCLNGQSDIFSCDNMDLLSQTSIADLGASGGNRMANDVWGFVDLNTEREYAIVGYNIGTAVVDVTQADNPVLIGRIAGQDTVWRDMKVYQFYDVSTQRWEAYAYVTADSANDGIAIIDLTELPNGISLAGRQTIEASAHNVYISNTDYATGLGLSNQSPVLYTAGANLNGGSFRGYDLDNPASPSVMVVANSGYMHDASSLVIEDSRKDTQCANAGATCNVLVDFNEQSFELWDVSNVGNPVQLSSRDYGNVNYVHSGWWSEDKQFIFVQDELDELNANLNTTLRVFDVSDLLNPVLATTWSGSTTAIDHNGFVKGNRYYMSNYERGITVLDITDPTAPNRVGFFDTFPNSNRAAFNGAWGAYPYLPSGNVLVSDDIGGLFVLSDNTRSSPQGQLGFSETSTAVTEGNTATINVQRIAGTTGAVSVDYWVLNASTDNNDYQPTQGTLNWNDGDDLDKSISLPVTADGTSEDVERLLIRLSNPQGGATLANTAASVFIDDAGSSPVIDMLEVLLLVSEDDSNLFVTVKRIGSAQGQVTVDYETVSGTAIAGEDFVAANGTLTWDDGDATGRTIPVALIQDTEVEESESFSLELVSPVGATVLNSSTRLNINEANRAPSAVAGADITVNERSQVTLSGDPSSDPDGDTLSYAWTQIAGRQIPLVDAATANVTLVIPDVGRTELTSFELRVTDPDGLSDTDTVSVTINNVSNTASGGGGGRIGIWAILLLLSLVCRHAVLATRRQRV